MFYDLSEYDVIFPQYENYHQYMVQVLFFMKYFGHFSLSEVYSLPVFYRNKMLELLQERLERENGNNTDVEKAQGTDLNVNQMKTLSDVERLKSIISASSVSSSVGNLQEQISSIKNRDYKSIL